ncbi:helix-turn-helix domain-containing protein [Schaalia turicensis]
MRVRCKSNPWRGLHKADESISAIARVLNVSRSTIHRTLN